MKTVFKHFINGFLGRPIEAPKVSIKPLQEAPKKKEPRVKKEKEIIYNVNKEACEYYLLQRTVDKGMHNLTSKFHRKTA